MKSLRYDKLEHIFKTSPLQWRLPVVQMESHQYGVLVFDEATPKKHYSYASLFSLLTETRASDKSQNKSIINCIYANPILESCWIHDFKRINYGVSVAEKNSYVLSILMSLSEELSESFSTVLFQKWCATEKNIQFVAEIEKIFWCPIRSNRLVSEDGYRKNYVAVKNLKFSAAECLYGKLISLKKFPKDHQVKLFRITNKNDAFDYLITNQLQQRSDDTAQLINSIYWMTDCVNE